MSTSFDEWIQPEGDRHQNASVSIHPKGEMSGLSMDLTLRKESAGRRGLQDVHRMLWQNHRVDQGGISEADVLAALQQISGRSWQDFLEPLCNRRRRTAVLAQLRERFGINWVDR